MRTLDSIFIDEDVHISGGTDGGSRRWPESHLLSFPVVFLSSVRRREVFFLHLVILLIPA